MRHPTTGRGVLNPSPGPGVSVYLFVGPGPKIRNYAIIIVEITQRQDNKMSGGRILTFHGQVEFQRYKNIYIVNTGITGKIDVSDISLFRTISNGLPVKSAFF